MNTATALAGATAPVRLEELLALVGFPSQRQARTQLSSSAQEFVRGMTALLDHLLLRAASASTREEFIKIRNENFNSYATAVTSLARLVRLFATEPALELALAEAFCEMEAAFRDHGVAHFGQAAKDQAMFTVWTLRRMSRYLSKITNAASSTPLSDEEKTQDEELARNYAWHALWAQYCLDCLLFAIRRDVTIQLAVLPEIIDGLRAAVDAYGYARQGLDLRTPRTEPLLEAVQWDEEDQELLNSSMDEMEVEALGD